MRKVLSSILAVSRRFKTATGSRKAYRLVRYLFISGAVGYLLLLSFPQVLFAHEISYRNFTVYSREPLDKNIYAVLDTVEAKLAASKLNDQEVKSRIFIADSHGFYALISLYIGGNSFGKGFPVLPTTNIFVNKSDIAKNLVYRKAVENNQRNLTGVIAHEVTHLLIRKRIGYCRNLTLPVWKREGYAEYVAGGSTLPYEVGVQMWKANPKDGTGYQYFKYYMLVKYLLEHDKLSVEDLFNRDFDVPSLEQRVVNTL